MPARHGTIAGEGPLPAAPTPTAETLPWLGLGLSTNLGDADVPDPRRLAAEYPGLVDFVEYSAPLRLAEAALAPRFAELRADAPQRPLLFHPVHLNLWGPDLEDRQRLADLAAHAAAVGSPWVGNDVAWWHVAGRPFPGYLYLPPPLNRRGLEQAWLHARQVQAALDRPLCLENPTVVARRGDLHVLDFMAELSAASGCRLILDLGHLLAFQLASGLPIDAGLDGFPLERVVEIHLAGGVAIGAAYFDDHSQPVREELFELLERILPRCPGLRAVTFEGDGHPEPVAALTLRRLRQLLPPAPPTEPPEELAPNMKLPPAPTPEAAARQAGGGTAGEGAADRGLAGAWQVFESSFGRAPDSAPGAAIELDQRLAVLAQTLDRTLPLTRALLAGDRDGLLAFQRSAEFGAAFDGQSAPLSGAFAAFARRKALAERDGPLSQVLAFEMLLQQPGDEGRGQLASGVRLLTFPSDLTELLFARGALDRHLGARARATGTFDQAGLSALRQVAGRAPVVAWGVAIRPEAWPLPLDAPLLAVLRRAASADSREALSAAAGLDPLAYRRALQLKLLK